MRKSDFSGSASLRVRMNDTPELIEVAYGLDRRTLPPRLWRGVLRNVVHFFSYHLILKRRTTRVTRAAGFKLIVRPTVFHPRHFITSEFFASVIGRLDLRGKRVADVGTGSGILAFAAARAGAASVTAVDINPTAALTAAENARANGLSDRCAAVCSDLLTGLAAGAIFDVIISSPPSFPGSRAILPIERGMPARTTATLLLCSVRHASGWPPAGASICWSRPIPTSICSAR